MSTDNSDLLVESVRAADLPTIAQLLRDGVNPVGQRGRALEAAIGLPDGADRRTCVQLLLDSGCSDATTEGRAINLAIEERDPTVLGLLLQYPCSVNARDGRALRRAVQTNQAAAVSMLIAEGAHVWTAPGGAGLFQASIVEEAAFASTPVFSMIWRRAFGHGHDLH